MTIGKSGFLYIYTSNEAAQDVFFDNLIVTQKTGPIMEETHYYPFGLSMAGISSNALKGTDYPKNRKEDNGIEHTTDLDLNQSDAQFRNLDPQIGRWWQIDPKPNFSHSLYTSMDNNPIRFNDFLGDTATAKGRKADIVAFIAMLNKTTGNTYKVGKSGEITRTNKILNTDTDKTKSGDLSKLIDGIINAETKMTFNIVKNDNQVLLDQFSSGKFDVGDYGKISDNALLAGFIGHAFEEWNQVPDASKRDNNNFEQLMK